jgi:hypothetical protein
VGLLLELLLLTIRFCYNWAISVHQIKSGTQRDIYYIVPSAAVVDFLAASGVAVTF